MEDFEFDLNALEGNARGVEESLLHPWSWKMEIPWKHSGKNLLEIEKFPWNFPPIVSEKYPNSSKYPIVD